MLRGEFSTRKVEADCAYCYATPFAAHASQALSRPAGFLAAAALRVGRQVTLAPVMHRPVRLGCNREWEGWGCLRGNGAWRRVG